MLWLWLGLATQPPCLIEFIEYLDSCIDVLAASNYYYLLSGVSLDPLQRAFRQLLRCALFSYIEMLTSSNYYLLSSVTFDPYTAHSDS